MKIIHLRLIIKRISKMDWGEIKSDWINGIPVSFVNKDEGSSNIMDFTKADVLDDAMRFDVISSLDIAIPKKDESVFMITTKAISLLDVMNWMEKKIGKIEEAVIFLYTINEKAVNYIVNLSGRCRLKIIVSDIMNSNRRKEKLIWEVLDNNNVDFVFVHSHAKIVSFRIGENYYTLSGSMNAGANARVESLQLNNSIRMYDFIDETFEMLRKKFSVKKRLNG